MSLWQMWALRNLCASLSNNFMSKAGHTLFILSSQSAKKIKSSLKERRPTLSMCCIKSSKYWSLILYFSLDKQQYQQNFEFYSRCVKKHQDIQDLKLEDSCLETSLMKEFKILKLCTRGSPYTASWSCSSGSSRKIKASLHRSWRWAVFSVTSYPSGSSWNSTLSTCAALSRTARATSSSRFNTSAEHRQKLMPENFV